MHDREILMAGRRGGLPSKVIGLKPKLEGSLGKAAGAPPAMGNLCAGRGRFGQRQRDAGGLSADGDQSLHRVAHTVMSL